MCLDALTLGRGNMDGIGLLHDDSSKWIRRVSYEIDLSEGEEFTEITIEEAS